MSRIRTHHRRRTGCLGPGPPRGQRGAIGGLEVLPFGFLIFVVVVLLVANAWAVVDAKLAVESAAREATRAHVEARSAAGATSAADHAAREAIAGAGRDPSRLGLSGSSPGFRRCAVVTYEASYTVPAVALPWIGGFGDGITVQGRHQEIIDPFRAGIGREDDCGF